MKLVRLLAAFGAADVLSAQATQHDTSHATHPAQASAPAAAMADGEVRRLDKAQGKLTLRHGPLTNLDMPAMTMVFKVTDPKMLDALKEGDKVRFTADKVDGVITVTTIEPSK
jgi:Cu(I)/Ag(I) efflux system periplasmic protein CusF